MNVPQREHLLLGVVVVVPAFVAVARPVVLLVLGLLLPLPHIWVPVQINLNLNASQETNCLFESLFLLPPVLLGAMESNQVHLVVVQMPWSC